MITRSPMECPGRLKWAATGFSIFLVLTSDLWPLKQMFKAFPVSPTYCLLHFLHTIRYTRFLILHRWLLCVPCMIGQSQCFGMCL